MLSLFRVARRRSLPWVAIVFILASFVFAGSASAGEVLGVPPAPPPTVGPDDFTDADDPEPTVPPGPDDFTDAEPEPTVAPGPDDFTDAEFEPTVVPGPDDFTSADPGAPDPDDGPGIPEDGAEPVGLVSALPATGIGTATESNDRDLTPLLVLAAAAGVLATALLRSGSDGGSRWGGA